MTPDRLRSHRRAAGQRRGTASFKCWLGSSGSNPAPEGRQRLARSDSPGFARPPQIPSLGGARVRSFAAALGFALALLTTPALSQAPDPSSEKDPPEPAEARPGVARLKVELTPEEITVGDRVEAQLTLVWMGEEPTAEPRFPAWQETWGKAEVLETGEVEAFTDQSARRIYRQKVTLTAFETGDVQLPRVAVAVPLADETRDVTQDDPVAFTVTSVLPAEADEGDGGEGGDGGEAAELAPRDAAPLRSLVADQRFLWTAIALAAACWLLVWRLARKLGVTVAGVAPKPLAPPLDELLERLRQLDPSAGEPAHTGLSLSLRNFLGRSLGFHAVESTTSEIQRRLRETPLPPTVAQGTVHLLRDCDQVKFARLEVPESTTDDRLYKARELAREIDLGLRPPEPVAEAAE